jgi:hypothetical protein
LILYFTMHMCCYLVFNSCNASNIGLLTTIHTRVILFY